jgi:hypothetical protein
MGSANDGEKLSSEETNPLGLDAEELDILRMQIEVPSDEEAGYLAIYQYADSLDFAIMAGAAVLSAASGASLPVMTVGLTIACCSNMSDKRRSSSVA